MDRKIKNATSYYFKYRLFGDHNSVKNDAANYFADSYEEYLILWDHLRNL